jgi:hypothetical protein
LREIRGLNGFCGTEEPKAPQGKRAGCAFSKNRGLE